ncbi:MAG: HD domain-containing protein [Treponema sp.]|nr:HD domain-containing protein [Treponema sp.]
MEIKSSTKNLSSFVSSGNEDLDRLLKFTVEADKMTHIERRTLLTDGSRRENDAEHSWHISLMCMIFSEFAKEKPDVMKAANLCIAHDLIEIYAGDTFAFDKEANKTKALREQQAADKLFSILPEKQAKTLRALWEEFDAMETVEAKFANCMDRIQPFLHNTLTGGHTWLQASATRQDVENRMAPVKDFMPEIWNWVQKNIETGIKSGWISETHKSAEWEHGK